MAVGGLVRISNCAVLSEGELVDYHMPWNPIVGMQILEYDRSFMASRILMDKFNGNLIISGAFGLFKKDMVEMCIRDRHITGGDFILIFGRTKNRILLQRSAVKKSWWMKEKGPSHLR